MTKRGMAMPRGGAARGEGGGGGETRGERARTVVERRRFGNGFYGFRRCYREAYEALSKWFSDVSGSMRIPKRGRA